MCWACHQPRLQARLTGTGAQTELKRPSRKPQSILAANRGGAGACTTLPGQVRQAYLGRRITSTRNCSGITLGHVLADRMERASAAGAPPVLDIDYQLSPWQVFGIRAGAQPL